MVAMQVSARVHPGPSHERCPYCRDELQAADAELVECQGCGTTHHAACLEELGRCTIMGCDRAAPLTELPALGPGGSASRRAAVRATIRERAERARRFARRNMSDTSGEPIDHDEARRRAARQDWESPEPGLEWEGPPRVMLVLAGLLVVVFVLAMLVIVVTSGGTLPPPAGG